MPATEFISRCRLRPEEIDGAACTEALIRQMQLGLEGKGPIPMNPSYLSLAVTPPPDIPCCIMDAGGTNLRIAAACFDASLHCTVTGLTKVPMLGMTQECSFGDFYGRLADHARATGHPQRIGLCFSYNLEHRRDLDGILQSWCKEIRIPQAVGKPVGASLREALGGACRKVQVVNDSVAALLGAHHQNRAVTLGVILGTGINICYSEQCRRIPKVPRDLKEDSMVISTEIGEFRGIPKTVFDEAVIAASDEPGMAHAEKQCSGAYLGELISRAWQQAAEEGLLEAAFAAPVPLPQISEYVSGRSETLPESPAAKQIARTMICRAAKIAAILTAGAILLSHEPGSVCTMVIEGSQYQKLAGFAPAYEDALQELLSPHDISFRIFQTENSCLIGAALTAFAREM